jgi:repressor LexA
MMMARRTQGLGERHRKIMEYLTEFQESSGYSPSIRQIGKSIGVESTSLVDYYLNQLEELGFIKRDDRVSRSIRVLRPVYVGNSYQTATVRKLTSASEIVTLPLAGRIVASKPIPMPETDVSYYDQESTVEIARSLFSQKEKVSELFALEVQGDSMIDAMVNDGDIVVLRQSSTAENGDMVAVWLKNASETTLKYFYRDGTRIRLQPANPTMQPIMIDDPAQVQIMGKVVLVVRQMSSSN